MMISTARTTLALVFTLMAACGGGKSADVGNMQKLADEACACKDVTCANAVKAKWDDFDKKRSRDLSGSDADAFKKQALRYATCVSDITNAAADAAPSKP